MGFVHLILAVLVGYGVTLVAYRLFFAPIATFPGSRLAAATGWYEFYYDVLRPGKYFKKISEMHDEYGPIIRINPWELSVRDGGFYRTLYVLGGVRRTQIFPRYMAGIGIEGSIPVSEDHHLHRARRKGLDPFFSRRGIEVRERLIVAELKMLNDRLASETDTGRVLDMETVFSAVTGDITGRICVPDPPCFVLEPNFAPQWHDTLRRFFSQAILYTHFKFLMGWLQFIPLNTLLLLMPDAGAFRKFLNTVSRHVSDSIKREEEGRINCNDPTNTLIEHLLASNMPTSEKRARRLTAEFIAILAAGTGTVSRTLSTIVYFVLADPKIEERLRNSLGASMASFPETMPKVWQLEGNPFLVACVKEGLRLSHGTMRRVPRCAPDHELQYKQWIIPKGTPVGISAFDMHTDSEIYPNPFDFVPERWLGDYDPLLDRNFVPFCYGSRNCLGVHLAYAELYLTLAVLFRPNGPRLKLFETDKTDVIPAHDFFLAVPKQTSKGASHAACDSVVISLSIQDSIQYVVSLVRTFGNGIAGVVQAAMHPIMKCLVLLGWPRQQAWLSAEAFDLGGDADHFGVVLMVPPSYTRLGLQRADFRQSSMHTLPHVPIIAGCGVQSAQETVIYRKDAAEAGAQWALVLPASYWVGAKPRDVWTRLNSKI